MWSSRVLPQRGCDTLDGMVGGSVVVVVVVAVVVVDVIVVNVVVVD